MEKDAIKNCPGMDRLKYQEFIYFIKTIRDPADSTCKNSHTVEFKTKLTAGQYANLKSVHLCFPMKIKKKTDETAHISSNMIRLNNFFPHWVRKLK